jgi:hypothetical protein
MKTAVMVVAFNRPEYFRQVIGSLEKNPEAEQLPFWLFLDHSPSEEGQHVLEIADTSKIRDKTVVRRAENLGLGRNIIDGLRRLFEREGYDRILVFEDDMLVNPQYIRLTLWLSDRYHRFANVATVQAHSKNPGDRDAQRRDLRRLGLTLQNFWGYCLTRPVWDTVSPYMCDYERLFLDAVPSYAERDHQGIRKWMRSLLSSEPRGSKGPQHLNVPERFVQTYKKRISLGRRQRLLDMLTPDTEWARRWAWTLRPTPTGQDAVMNLALQVEGLHRVTTRVPRTRYIGEHGEHANTTSYSLEGWSASQTFEWVEDEEPHGFKLPWE